MGTDKAVHPTDRPLGTAGTAASHSRPPAISWASQSQVFRYNCGPMKFCAVLILVLCFAFSVVAQQKPKVEEGPYPVDPDPKKQEGVAQGKVTQGSFADSEIYPGTERDYWVYEPAQYDASKPAALMVFQDGRGYHGTVSTARL